MKLLVTSDLHGNLDVLDKMDKQFAEADAVLFAGDFAQFKKPETGLPALEKFCKKHDTIFAVIGNCDEPELLESLEDKDISVEGSLVFHEGLAFAGSGGGSKFTGTTPNERTEEELVSDLAIVADQDKENSIPLDNLILIIHNPPKDTKCDMIENGAHVGSQQLRDFIQTTKPIAVVTGHIHESAGIDKIGDTVVINPGPLAEGKYAWLEVSSSSSGWKVDSATLETV
jgi:Icc-related predicted phosphoesterase